MIKRFHNRSIQYLISISFTTISVVAMILMGTILYQQFARQAQREAIETNKQLLDQASYSMYSYIRNMMAISDTMYYGVIKNKDLTYETMDEEMALLYENNKDNLVSITCVTGDGAIVAAAPVSTRKSGVDILNQDWFQNANKKIEKLHFSTPHVQNLFESSNYRYYWVVSLSRSVELTNIGGIRRGVLVVDMNFSTIEQLLNRVNGKGKGYVYLIDGNGELIYHPDQKAIYSNLVKENNQMAATYQDGENEETFLGKKRVVIVKTLGYTGWKLVSVIPNSEFSASLNQIRFFTLLVAIIAVMTIFIANSLISTRVTEPIIRLEDSIKYIESGNLNKEVYIGGTQEIRHLGETITSMIHQMKHLMDEKVYEQKEKRKSELDALQAQINPHFLYNTIDSVVWMIEAKRYQEAISMIKSLAKLFRISLSKGKNVISIRDEILHARNYMDIQRVRYKNKFEIRYEIDEAIEAYSTIKLILQPILENAIYYGVEHMDGEGEIVLRGYFDHEDICLEISDNGMGIPAETIPLLLTDDTRVHKKGSGIGLCNINQRIHLYFKGHYGLEIESELDEGTTVRVRLPQKPYMDEETRDEKK